MWVFDADGLHYAVPTTRLSTALVVTEAAYLKTRGRREMRRYGVWGCGKEPRKVRFRHPEPVLVGVIVGKR